MNILHPFSWDYKRSARFNELPDSYQTQRVTTATSMRGRAPGLSSA
jgi:hypothetical protein